MWGINVKASHNCSSLPDKKHRISLREHKSRPDSSLKDWNTDPRIITSKTRRYGSVYLGVDILRVREFFLGVFNRDEWAVQ